MSKEIQYKLNIIQKTTTKTVTATPITLADGRTAFGIVTHHRTMNTLAKQQQQQQYQQSQKKDDIKQQQSRNTAKQQPI